MEKFVFFATSWSSENGGINAINFDLCLALSKVHPDVYVVIPHATDEQHLQANDSGIVLIEIKDEYTTYNKTLELVKIALNCEVFCNINWVGHDAITGGAAILSSKVLGGKSIIFHHMDYSNYYYLKSNNVKEKITTQRSVLRAADVVIAIGPRLSHSAKHIRPRTKETYSLIPGAPVYERSIGKFDYRVTICGRLEITEDTVKNISAGFGAAIRALSQSDYSRGSINLIGSLGKDALGQINKHNNSVAVNAYPYIKNRNEYFEILSFTDLLLMPSVKEGFGLVAWEAICLGIPVIISKSSGVYEFIDSLGYVDYIIGVEISGIIAVDEKAISCAISIFFEDYQKYFDNSKKLANKLLPYTWTSTAESFLALASGNNADPVITHDTFSEMESVDKLVLPISSTPLKNRSKGITLDKDSQVENFERFEDLLSINFKKRELVFPKNETTNYSKGKKIKFEFWKVHSPQASYFLYINPGSNIAQTIKLFSELISAKKIQFNELFILRRDSGDAAYMSKVFSENGFKVILHEYSLKEYIWEYCIDDAFKVSTHTDSLSNYIDQSLEIDTNGTVSEEPSRAFLLNKFIGKPESSAYLVVATGGMGKTWLCRSLVIEISRQYNDKLIVLIQAETLRNYFLEVGFAHIHVKSVFELYEIHEKSIRAKNSFDQSTFELAVISGNILVIIDGLDELATVLQERFDIISFLNSVRNLSMSMQSSQILLTTRDNLLVGSTQTEEYGLEKFNLLGFSSVDWMRYAAKRFNENSAKIELTNRLNKVLSGSDLAGPEGRVIPFLVDVVSNILEEEEKDNSDFNFELSKEETAYPSNNDLIDRVVCAIFDREIRRQNINITIEQLVSLLSEIVSENGEQFDIKILKHQLELYYESRANELFKKIILNPLFMHSGDTLRLRYGFLQSYFRSILIIESLKRTSLTHEALGALAKANADDSPEISYVKKYFSSKVEELDAVCIPYFNGMRKIFQNQSNEIKQIEVARRAISGLLKIYAATRSFSGRKLTEKIAEFLPSTANNGQSIDGLCIYGEFPVLDFSEIMTINAKFLGYDNFQRCKFRNSKFIYSIFENCAADNYLSDSISLAEFDDTCSLGDISKVIDTAKSKEVMSQKTLDADALIFLRSFFVGGTRYDPKRSWIKFSSRIGGLKANAFDKLIPTYFVVKSKKSDETYYSISENFLVSARKFIDNNYKDDTFRKFLKFISS